MFNNRLNMFLGLLLLCVWPSTSFGWVKFYESEHRIEAKPEQTEVAVSYRFANKGSKAIKILSTESSCGCTTAKLEKTTYEPGERGAIQVRFEFGDRDGWQQKTITVKTDDPQTPVKVLKLSVNIPRLAMVGPKVLQWMSPGSSAKITQKWSGPRLLRFMVQPGLDMKVTAVEYDEAALHLKELKVDDANERLWVVLPKDMNKPIESAIRIKTNYPESAPKEYTVQVAVVVPQSASASDETGKTSEKVADTASAEKKQVPEKKLSPMADWMRRVRSESDDLPLRLDRNTIMFPPVEGVQTQYMGGVILSDKLLEIQKIEIKNFPECSAELVDLGWDGYFMIKFTMDPSKASEADAQSKADHQQAAEAELADKDTDVQTADKTDKVKSKAKSSGKHGQILIHTNPPAPVPFPIYGVIAQPSTLVPQLVEQPKEQKPNLKDKQ